jgi:hypothetical protein
MKKHFALYFTNIVNAMISAIEKHNGIPFRKTVTIFEHDEAHPLFRAQKRILISFSSNTSFFHYSIGIIQTGHLVEVQLFRSRGALIVDSLGVITLQDSTQQEAVNKGLEIIAAVSFGTTVLREQTNVVVPTIELLYPYHTLALNVPKERCGDTVQTLILLSNLLRELGGVVAHINTELQEYQMINHGEVDYPKIIEEAKTEEGMLDEVSFQTA